MSDPATPEKGTELKPNEFTYGKNEDGDLMIDGVVVERYGGRFQGDATSEVPVEDDEPTGGPNAAVEGEQARVAEQAKPVDPPLAPVPAEPTKPPEKQKFKLKVHGEDIERELSPEEIVAKLQMAEDYHLKTSQLAEQRRKIEPFLPIIDKPVFKQIVDEMVSRGEIEAPQPTTPPSPEDVIGYRLRCAEPDFKEIQASVTEWATTLPVYEADILDKNHKAFNDAYDRFKGLRASKIAPTVAPPAPSTADIEKSIAAKEVAKETARVEAPTGTTPEVDPAREWKKIDRQLERAVKTGQRHITYRGRNMDAELAWVMHRTEAPDN